MSLTKEDLQAISDLIDVKLDKHEKRFDAIDKRFEKQEKTFNARFDGIDKRFEQVDKRFDEQEQRFKEMLIDNNMLIAEHIQRVVSESEKRLSKEIQEIRNVTAQNSYDIASLKQKIS